MAVTASAKKFAETAGKIAICVFGALVILVLVAGTWATRGAPATSKPSYTRVTMSAWCMTHAHDQWSGVVDDTTRRYLRECAE